MPSLYNASGWQICQKSDPDQSTELEIRYDITSAKRVSGRFMSSSGGFDVTRGLRSPLGDKRRTFGFDTHIWIEKYTKLPVVLRRVCSRKRPPAVPPNLPSILCLPSSQEMMRPKAAQGHEGPCELVEMKISVECCRMLPDWTKCYRQPQRHDLGPCRTDTRNNHGRPGCHWCTACLIIPVQVDSSDSGRIRRASKR